MINERNTLLNLYRSAASIVPFYSARGCTHTLEPIEESIQVERDVNGEAFDLSWTQFRKYKSEVTCRDVEQPAFDGIWPGTVLVLDCVVELPYRTGTVGSPTRTVVSGSSRTEGDFTFYRPRLEMIFLGFATNMDEYAADVTWVARFTER
jgi:hypothetical protein